MGFSTARTRSNTVQSAVCTVGWKGGGSAERGAGTRRMRQASRGPGGGLGRAPCLPPGRTCGNWRRARRGGRRAGGCLRVCKRGKCARSESPAFVAREPDYGFFFLCGSHTGRDWRGSGFLLIPHAGRRASFGGRGGPSSWGGGESGSSFWGGGAHESRVTLSRSGIVYLGIEREHDLMLV